MARTKGSKNSAPFSIDKVDVQTATLPARTRSTGPGRYANNPMIERLRESYKEYAAGVVEGDNTRGGRSIAANGATVKPITAYLLAAAQSLADEEIGLRKMFRWEQDGEVRESATLKDVPKDADVPVTILFSGKTRNQRSSNDDESDADEMAEAEQDSPPEF